MMSYGNSGWRPWILDEEAARRHVRAAVDAGINFFDTADVYSVGVSEEVTGRLLRECHSKREDYVIATKVSAPMGDGPNDSGLSRGHILDSVDASLRRLKSDHIDLYQLHLWDPETPIEETMGAIDDVVHAGKVRYVGVSNFRAWQLAKAHQTAARNGWSTFVSMQNHYNLLHREDEADLLPMLADQKIASIPYSPLARGILARAGTGKEREGYRYETDKSAANVYGTPDQEVLQRVAKIASDRDVSPAQISLAWLLHQPVVTAPIVGVTKEKHLSDALAAVDLELTESELSHLNM